MGTCRFLITKKCRTRNKPTGLHQLCSSSSLTNYKSLTLYFAVHVYTHMNIRYTYNMYVTSMSSCRGHTSRQKSHYMMSAAFGLIVFYAQCMFEILNPHRILDIQPIKWLPIRLAKHVTILNLVDLSRQIGHLMIGTNQEI